MLVENSAFDDVKLIFDMNIATHKQMFDIWTAENPFTGKCTEVDEHVQMLEKCDQNDSPFSGLFGFVRTEDPTTINMKIELKHVGDRVYSYVSGVLDIKHPDGFEFIEEGKSFSFKWGITAVLQEDGNFECGKGFGLVKVPSEPPIRHFTEPEDAVYEGKEVFCIGKADKIIERAPYMAPAEGSNDRSPKL